MTFKQVKSGMTLFDIKDRELSDYPKWSFRARVYYLVFRKDSQSATLLEISESDAAGEWSYSIRKIDPESWKRWSWDKIDVVPKSQFFDTLFTKIKSMYPA